jgi:hypothetical protein
MLDEVSMSFIGQYINKCDGILFNQELPLWLIFDTA